MWSFDACPNHAYIHPSHTFRVLFHCSFTRLPILHSPILVEGTPSIVLLPYVSVYDFHECLPIRLPCRVNTLLCPRVGLSSMIGAGVCKRTLAVISFVGDGNDTGANANTTASVVRCITFRGNVSGPSTEKALYLLIPLLLSTLLGVIGSFPRYEAGDSPGSSYNVLPSTLVGVGRLLVLQYAEHLMWRHSAKPPNLLIFIFSFFSLP